MNEFESYLIGKKIDPAVFRKKQPSQYVAFENLFMQMHPKSFTAQKLFLINSIRREYPLQEDASEEKSVKKVKMKPKITPRTKK